MIENFFKLKFIEGHRTQIAAWILALLTLAVNMAWISPEDYTKIMGFLTSIGLLTAAAHKTT